MDTKRRQCVNKPDALMNDSRLFIKSVILFAKCVYKAHFGLTFGDQNKKLLYLLCHIFEEILRD